MFKNSLNFIFLHENNSDSYTYRIHRGDTFEEAKYLCDEFEKCLLKNFNIRIKNSEMRYDSVSHEAYLSFISRKNLHKQYILFTHPSEGRSALKVLPDDV